MSETQYGRKRRFNYTVMISTDSREVMVREGDEMIRGSILYVIGEENTDPGYQITYQNKYMEPMELLNIDG